MKSSTLQNGTFGGIKKLCVKTTHLLYKKFIAENGKEEWMSVVLNWERQCVRQKKVIDNRKRKLKLIARDIMLMFRYIPNKSPIFNLIGVFARIWGKW